MHCTAGDFVRMRTSVAIVGIGRDNMAVGESEVQLNLEVRPCE